jgi:hypothetical protein
MEGLEKRPGGVKITCDHLEPPFNSSLSTGACQDQKCPNCASQVIQPTAMVRFSARVYCLARSGWFTLMRSRCGAGTARFGLRSRQLPLSALAIDPNLKANRKRTDPSGNNGALAWRARKSGSGCYRSPKRLRRAAGSQPSRTEAFFRRRQSSVPPPNYKWR